VTTLGSPEISGSDVMNDLTVLLFNSKSPSHYVRSCATHTLFGKHVVGSEMLIINSDASLTTVAAFGRSLLLTNQQLSLWDQNPVAETARTGQASGGIELDEKTGVETHYYCYPFSTPSHTIGVLVMIKSLPYEIRLDEQDQRTMSMFGGLWLESLGASIQKLPDLSLPRESTELTDRQQNILRMIAAGNTNVQIAAALILSESTIRQETVKIFRKLAVPNRTEATKKARLLGIFDQIAS